MYKSVVLKKERRLFMPEVQNVGTVDYAQYQPSQYSKEAYDGNYNTQPVVYDEHAEEISAASKSRFGATILSLAIVGGFALWGGHAWGKKSAAKEIEQLKDAAKNYEKAQSAMEEIEKLAKDGNDQYFGGNHCGNKLLNKIKELFKPFKKTLEDAGKKAEEKVESGAESSVKAAEDAVK